MDAGAQRRRPGSDLQRLESGPYLADRRAHPGTQLGKIENVIDDLDWMDPKRCGFLMMTFTASAAKGEWVFVDRIDSRSYAVDVAAGKTLVYTPGLG